MNKKLIKLTEQDLHRIVKESVGTILKESDYRHEGWKEDTEYINPTILKKHDRRNRMASRNKVLSSLNQAKRFLMMITPRYAFDAASSFYTGQKNFHAMEMSQDNQLINFINDAINNIEKAQNFLGANSYDSEYFNDEYADNIARMGYKNIKY